MRKEDFIGKTLTEALEMMPPQLQLAIGGEDASGYFYFGEVEDIMDGLNKAQDKFKKKFENKIENIMIIMNNAKAESEIIQNRLNNSEFKSPVLVEKLKKLESDQKYRQENIDKLKETIKKVESVDFANAIVSDIYKKKQDAQFALIISEKVLPYYWFRDEYVRGTAFLLMSIEDVYKRYPELIGKYDVNM